MARKYPEIDQQTIAIFNRQAVDVAPEISEKWYLVGQKPSEASAGHPTLIHISSKTGTLEYKILLVEAHSATNPNRIWKGKRLNELQSLTPGTIKAYGSRAGVIPFIVAFNGDNLAIRAIEQTSTGEVFRTASKVAKVLALSHSEEGRLTFIDSEHFNFEKIVNLK